MSAPLNYSIIGLQEYSVSFEKYCTNCEIQQYCEFGQENPFTIEISCKDINTAKENIKYEELKKMQDTETIISSYKDVVDTIKINVQTIFSQIWKKLIKDRKEVIRCLNAKKVDPILVTQQGQDWWQDFNLTMKLIYKECEKIL